VTGSAQGDRYEPLPGLLEIPGFLYRKLRRRGRRIVLAVLAILALALAAGVVFGLPAVTETKEERAAAEQSARERVRQAQIARLRAEQRLLRGEGTASAGLAGAQAIAARRALADDLTAAVEADARARVQAGELDQGVLRAECERYPRGARGEDPATNLASDTGRYQCLAITADAPRLETQQSSSLGYPYRALVDFPTGRFTYCKVSGRAGEGSIEADIPVEVPAACGGR
jgi:hypothetical protein